VRRAGEADAGRVLAPQLQDALAVPVGHEVERLVVGVLQPRALDVQVEVGDVDELGPVPVAGGGDRARHRLLADL
jgi:hypothetical protein